MTMANTAAATRISGTVTGPIARLSPLSAVGTLWVLKPHAVSMPPRSSVNRPKVSASAISSGRAVRLLRTL